MINFLRISSIYPGFHKKIISNINQKDSYEKTLNIVFDQKYSVSNYLSKELSKKNYKCNEIIHNFQILQKKWFNEYGKNYSNEKIIFQQIRFYNPEVLFIGDLNLLDKFFFEKLKSFTNIKLIMCYHCAPLSKKNLINLKYADTIVTCTEGYSKRIKSITKKDTFLLQHAHQKTQENKKKTLNRNIDIGFIGSIFLSNKLHLGRVEIIYKLIKDYKNNFFSINFSKFFIIDYLLLIIYSVFNFKFFKKIKIFYQILYIYLFSKKPIFGKDMLRTLRKTKILINKHIEDTEFAGNMRLFEGTGSGCLLVTDYKSGLEKLFEIDNEIVVYSNQKQLFEKVDYYLKNQKKLSQIAKKGYSKSISAHNYEIRVNHLDKYIKDKLHYETSDKKYNV